MLFSMRVVFVAVTLLTATTSQECDIPTSEEVEDVAEAILGSELPEGSLPPSITLMQMHFTCLATVALDKFSWASVVVNFTDTDVPGVAQVRQFQMACTSFNMWERDISSFDPSLPAMPFDIETQYQCAQCLLVPPTSPNYDPVSNCLGKCVHI